jgi:hypothetical protein
MVARPELIKSANFISSAAAGAGGMLGGMATLVRKMLPLSSLSRHLDPNPVRGAVVLDWLLWGGGGNS